MTSTKSSPGQRRRERDSVQIPGDYQAQALKSERKAQRFWHEAKFRLIEHLAQPRPTDRVLDAGCGSGTITNFLGQYAQHVIGADSNPEAIAYATQAYLRPGVEFRLGQFENLLEESPFDSIYCIEVIEHLYEEQVAEVLRLFRKLAKPNAKLFLTSPNYRSAWPIVEWLLDFLHLVPPLANEQHISHFTKARLRKACERAGWTVTYLGTFNALAPFLAPISRRLALRTEKMEHRWSEVIPGNLLCCVCQNSP